MKVTVVSLNGVSGALSRLRLQIFEEVYFFLDAVTSKEQRLTVKLNFKILREDVYQEINNAATKASPEYLVKIRRS